MGGPRPLRLPRRPVAHRRRDPPRLQRELTIDAEAIAAIVAVVVAAAGQAITAIGFSLVSVPFVSLAVGPAAAVPTINLLAGSLNAVMLYAEREHTRWRDVALLLAPAAVTIPIVGVLIKRLDTDSLSVINGAAILLGTAFLAKGLRVRSLRGRRGAILAGAISGAGNVATSVGGPPVAMYAVNAEWPAVSFRPTIQAFFLGINIMSVLVRGWPRVDEPTLLPILAVAMLVGWVVGRHVALRVDDHIVRNLLLVAAALGGTVAVLRGIL